MRTEINIPSRVHTHWHSTPRTQRLHPPAPHSAYSPGLGAYTSAAATAQRHHNHPTFRADRCIDGTQRNGKERGAPCIHPAEVPVRRRRRNEAPRAEVSAHTSRAPALR
jgi:hypothetical protein